MNIYQNKVEKMVKRYMQNIEHANFFFEISKYKARKQLRADIKKKKIKF